MFNSKLIARTLLTWNALIVLLGLGALVATPHALRRLEALRGPTVSVSETSATVQQIHSAPRRSARLIPSLPLFGPFVIHPFGVLVVTGVLAGMAFVRRRVRREGLSVEKMEGLISATLATGFIGAHLLDVVFYRWNELLAEGPILLFKLWDGISSYGGFIGAILGFVYYASRHIEKNRLAYLDILVQGLVIGWIFGRLGCTVSFDHPGNKTDFFMAFDYPGGARHNLGFYEALFTAFVLVPASRVVDHFRLKAGYHAIVVALLYAPVRFLLDFLRSTDQVGSDTLYFGLTFAHYSSVALILIVLGLWAHVESSESGVASRAFGLLNRSGRGRLLRAGDPRPKRRRA